MTYFIGSDDDSKYQIHLIVKIICTCFAFICFTFFLLKLKNTDKTVYELIYQEKKHTKKIFRRNLQTF